MIFAGGARRQLLFAFAALLAVVLIGTGMGFTGVYVLSEEMAAVTTDQLANSARIARAQWGVWELRFGLAQYIINTDPQSRAKIKQDEAKWVQTVRDNMANYKESRGSEAEKRLLAEWNEAFNSYLEARPHWFELMDQGKLAEAADWRAKKTNFYGGAAVNAFMGLLDEQDKAVSLLQARVKELQFRSVATMWAMLVLGLVALAVGLVFGMTIVLRITRKLSAIAAQLEQAAQQTQNASMQVAQSSESMAQGASEQAANLDETSSTLEQISATTRQNAEHAVRMEQLIDATRENAGKGSEAMERMVERISAIKESSDKTARIVKTIDEIAFQTNLLALNAAVEAARAGDAGRGFAVVAEEVRNLALRSAQAAKDTSALIEESQQRALQGVGATTDAQALLKNIATNVEETSGVVREVSNASKEQSSSVEQISKAVAQMDQVTQSNAASAEENAAASEELSAQAASQSSLVRELTTLVLGRSGNGAAPGRGRTGEQALRLTAGPGGPALPQPH